MAGKIAYVLVLQLSPFKAWAEADGHKVQQGMLPRSGPLLGLAAKKLHPSLTNPMHSMRVLQATIASVAVGSPVW